MRSSKESWHLKAWRDVKPIRSLDLSETYRFYILHKHYSPPFHLISHPYSIEK